jgi:hypothetical protein
MDQPRQPPKAPFRKPDYWSDAPPPAPAPAKTAEDDALSPTRYGDWVIKGVAVDF